MSEARFSLSFDAIDCKAADARDTELEDGDPSSSGERATSGLLCTFVEAARGGRGGGTGRGGCGETSGATSSASDVGVWVGVESWSRPVNPVCDTGSLRVDDGEPDAGFFHKRYTLCSGAFFGSCVTAGCGGT